ncbi:endolytic transglycosylase MltG [Thiomicrorhabdus sp.]|uniref:endolytic transglycosylase MltG n=1 Tax=Thiomicrorhabdus sp. TaxID=2039724 RepID=UPI0029C698F6|nr:endolytic transglycosylase MltG [Thiomicrorhabdus sp.]
MKGFLKFFTALSIVLALLAGAFIWQIEDFLNQPISDKKVPLTISIEAGSSAAKVAEGLYQADYLSHPKWFLWYLKAKKQANKIKAGEHRIQPEWNVEQLMNQLVAGKLMQYPVALIPGETVVQTLKQIQQQKKLKLELPLEEPAKLQEAFGIDKPIDERYPYANLEGLFAPETYHYEANESDLRILQRARRLQEETLAKAWTEREEGLPLKTPYEALILASIVEKESSVKDELPKVAAVFINRMRKGMRLQTDPTVIYGIGTDYDGDIRSKDLRSKTPYNTYQIDGLPPTPIALPSKAAIEAVMHPADTKALYFVADGNGGHVFSNTLKEHNRAVKRYLATQK